MIDTICDVLQHSYQRGWLTTRDGNASFRRFGYPYLYITPSGVRKQFLNAESMIKLDLNPAIRAWSSPTPWQFVERVSDSYQDRLTGLQPSGELPMHVLLQLAVPTNRVVLHLHPTYTIAAMHAGWDLVELSHQFPEINRYTKVGPSVPMIPPVSEELARGVVTALGLDRASGAVSCDIVGLDRHGVVAVAENAWEAFEHAERLEHIAQIVLASGRRP
jgi:ribulose-5-phosphate 4-epimerase/fuculose-1-phosphate aldolase